jgi:MFS family permease
MISDATSAGSLEVRPSETLGREFQFGWPTIVAGAVGAGVGTSALFTYNAGLFVKDLQAAIGLTRTQYGLAYFLATLALATLLPIVGKLMDRNGPRLLVMAGAVGLAVGFTALGLLTGSVPSYIALMVLTGMLGVSSTALGYTRAVNTLFHTGRGLALGLTQLGVGLSASIVPPILGSFIAAHGWRAGYLLLAGLALAGLIPAGVALRGRGAAAIERVTHEETFARVRKSRTFRLQILAFVVMTFGFTGMLANFVPMLRDDGISIQAAGSLAGAIGIAVIVSRIAIGFIADHVEAPWLCAGVCIICSAGCLVLAFGGSTYARLGALALGTAIGAEADLMSYMTARYFGIASYARAYAWLYSAFILSAGLSPLWIGILFDRTGSYLVPLLSSSFILLVAVALFLRLPPTRPEAAPLNRF